MKSDSDRQPTIPCRGGVKKNFLFTLLLIVLSCAALLSLGLAARRAIQAGGSQDFQYSGVRVLFSGENPYTLWLTGDKSRFLLSQDPLYLPNMYYLLSPFALLDWPTARFLWMMVNVAMACGFAWVLYAAQKRQQDKRPGLLMALLFLSSNPVRNTIGNGQMSLLILLATLLVLSQRSKPLLSGIGLGISLAKYTFGMFFLAAELARRRIIAVVVAVAIVFAGFLGLAIQTHAPLNLHLVLGSIDVTKKYPSFADYFLWLHQHFGDGGVRLLPLIGLAVVFLRARALASASLPADEVDIKLACGATFASLLFAPHHGYDFVMLALPLATGCRLDNLKKLERWLYAATLLAYWNIASFLEGLHQPVVTVVKTTFLMLALAWLTWAFLAKASNLTDPAADGVKQ